MRGTQAVSASPVSCAKVPRTETFCTTVIPAKGDLCATVIPAKAGIKRGGGLARMVSFTTPDVASSGKLRRGLCAPTIPALAGQGQSTSPRRHVPVSGRTGSRDRHDVGRASYSNSNILICPLAVFRDTASLSFLPSSCLLPKMMWYRGVLFELVTALSSAVYW